MEGRPRWKARYEIWSERWAPAEIWVECLEWASRETGTVTCRGGEFDDWDLHLRGGLFGGVRGVVAVEEHGAGKQLVRMRAVPYVPRLALTVIVVLSTLTSFAAADVAGLAAFALGGIAAALGALVFRDCGAATGAWAAAAQSIGARDLRTR